FSAGYRCARADCALAAAAFAHCQTLLPVDPVELLPVHLPALTREQQMQSAIPKAPPFTPTAP
ncbi:hypothetical protein AL036_08810, partial [Salipiger aestuarii]